MNWYLGGRYGDLMQILPAIKHEHDTTGELQWLYCSEAFESLLDGCSYVNCIPLPYTWDNVSDSLELISTTMPGEPLRNCAIYGKRWLYQRKESNYQRDIWRNTGCPHAFGTIPLVFDRRDQEREAYLIKQLIRPNVPFILTHFESVSSPFDKRVQTFIDISHAREDVDIVDLSHVRAHRLYDFLGLMEKAKALVCCDSALLHLSRAVPSLPVLAFLSDQKKPWNTSEPHSGVIWHSLYSQIAQNSDSFKSALKSL